VLAARPFGGRRALAAAIVGSAPAFASAAGAAGLARGAGRIVDLRVAGGVGDDRADDTDAFLDALDHAAGGALLVPPGIFRVRADRVRLHPRTSLLGFGRSSVIRRIGDGTLVDASGASASDRLGGCLVRDVELDGARRSGTLVRCHHAHDLVFDNVWWRDNVGIGVGVDGVELWDSRFLNCTWDWCSGRDGASPSVLFRNRSGGASSGASSGGDNTNAVYFVNCRWESFRDGALWLVKAGPASASQIHLINCKMETAFVRGPFLSLSPDARNVVVQNLYLCGTAFDPGVSTPVDLVNFAPHAQAKLENVSVWLNGPVARTVVRAEVGHPSCSIQDVWVDGLHNPSVAVVESVGRAVPSIGRVGYVKSHPGTVQVRHDIALGDRT